MNTPTSCPLCHGPVYPSIDEYCCLNCNTKFSVILENAILLESAGSIPKDDFIVLSD